MLLDILATATVGVIIALVWFGASFFKAMADSDEESHGKD